MSLENEYAKIQQKRKKWEKQKLILETALEIKQERKALKNKNKIPTSKKLITFLFINCSIIELFTGWVTIQSFTLAFNTGLPIDFAPLIALIGAVVGEVIGFAIYSLKSCKENTEGGLTYMLAQQNLNNDEEIKG